MEILCYGCDTTHQTGEFCKRMIVPYYFIGCFSTPFVYESNGTLYTGNAGDILITPPGSAIYHGPKSNDGIFVNDWMYVYGDDFDKILKKYPLPTNSAFSVGNKNYLKSCLEKIQKELTLKQNGYDELIFYNIAQTVIELHRLHQSRNLYDVSVARIESLKERMVQNLSKEWTLREMAEFCGYSVTHFSSLYMKRFGISPKADLISLRIGLAKQLLYYGELSVAEISKQCGFQTIYYFSTMFKKITGMSPSEYKKQSEFQ